MATYLLLRDNKQSGPYTFDEIKAKGFKAYDLVWIEGKSAAWRYPGEIEEFKLIAPPVEEQPFDRFYKKPAQNHSTSITSSVIQDHVAGSHPADKVIREINTNTNDSSKKIYVNLPAAQKNNFIPEKKETEKKKTEEKEKREADIKQIIAPAVKEVPKQSPFFPEQNYVQDKQAYISKTSYKEIPAKTEIVSNSRKDSINKYFFSIVSAVLLLASGIAIGLLINRNSVASNNGNRQEAANNTSAIKQDDNKISSIPVSNPVAEQSQPIAKKDTIVTINRTKSLEEKRNILTADNASKKKTTDKDKTDAAQQFSAPPAAPVNPDSSNSPYFAKREAIHRSDVAADKDNNGNAHTTSLVNLVSVTANKYNVGTFGGISDLQLTINNQSSHALDLVVVEVQYIQANKKVYKTENISFRNIGAGASLTEEAPSTSRGIKVQYRVTVINTKEQGLSFSAL